MKCQKKCKYGEKVKKRWKSPKVMKSENIDICKSENSEKIKKFLKKFNNGKKSENVKPAKIVKLSKNGKKVQKF